MSRVKKWFASPVPLTKNMEGYPAYDRSLEERYLQCLLTNTISNTYYATGNELLPLAGLSRFWTTSESLPTVSEEWWST